MDDPRRQPLTPAQVESLRIMIGFYNWKEE
jgi:hypothetical protein